METPERQDQEQGGDQVAGDKNVVENPPPAEPEQAPADEGAGEEQPSE